MARNNLSRHEELRYEYLLKNLEYLSLREKQEFNYLYNKKQAGEVNEPPRSQPSSAYMTITTMIIMTVLMIIKRIIMMTITGPRKGFPNTQKKKSSRNVPLEERASSRQRFFQLIKTIMRIIMRHFIKNPNL